MFIRGGVRMLVQKNLGRERAIQGVENSVTGAVWEELAGQRRKMLYYSSKSILWRRLF